MVGAVFVVGMSFVVVGGWCATPVALRRVVSKKRHAGSLVGAVLVVVVVFEVAIE